MRGVKGTRTTLATALVALAAPAGVMADATPAPENRYSSNPGLPDGRVYEEVSPANKEGHPAGVENNNEPQYALAAADGNGLLFYSLGPIGASSLDGSFDQPYVARRSPGGWSGRGLLPQPPGRQYPPDEAITASLPSLDLSRYAFVSVGSFVPGNPNKDNTSESIYIASEDGSVDSASAAEGALVTWVGRPLIASPDPSLGEVRDAGGFAIAGSSTTLDTLYFTYYGTLVPEDASREAVLHERANEYDNDWGFYEWSEARGLVNAGELPPGSPYGPFDPYGAVPAVTLNNYRFFSDEINNQVAGAGSRQVAFFLSPTPESGSGRAPELYMREVSGAGAAAQHRSVLVSHSQLPGSEGQPAPSGPAEIVQPETSHEARSYVFAAPDGSRAFFASTDSLTPEAKLAEESGLPAGSVKEYEFDTASGALSYLPGVAGPLLVSTNDGSRFLFENTEKSPAEIELWSEGRISPVAPAPASSRVTLIGPARAAAGGSVFVFATNAEVPGFNDAGGFKQVFRYDAMSNSLGCVSCPPSGIAPSGDAILSNDDSNVTEGTPQDNRGVSSDGSRVFFDTPDPLVAKDVNGARDVYEWEDGTVYLLSSGSGENSYLLDNGESGGDAFFTTAAGLVPGDTDEAYDVYDARIPRPGDTPPPSAVPCQGSVCQGPPSVASALGAPATETFTGLGNRPAVSEARPAGKPKIKKKKRRRRARRGRRTVRNARHASSNGRGR